MRADNNKEPIILYMHAGSKNHGCEAIVNSLCHILESKYDKNDRILLTYRADEDNAYSLKKLCRIVEERKFENHRLMHLFLYIYRKISRDYNCMMRYRYKEILDSGANLAVSIGGDNYCYDDMLNDLFLSNNVFNKSGFSTILYGCSIEPELLERQDIYNDLLKYKAIIARESITYEALKSHFSGKDTAIYLYPDPAFTLESINKDLPEGFLDNNTVGINISPMILSNETIPGMTLEAYKKLIQFICDNTDMNIALIPHVVWDSNDDRKTISKLFEYVKEYRERICILEDDSASVLKGYIGRCRFFVGARTHSTIAAYSSMVPTLVVGYSVKARGIARDLFPSYDVDDLVVSVQKLDNAEILVEKFKWLQNNEIKIKEDLIKKIPEYCKKAKEVIEVIK